MSAYKLNSRVFAHSELVGWLLVFFVIAASGKRKHITVASMRIIMGHRRKKTERNTNTARIHTHTQIHTA